MAKELSQLSSFLVVCPSPHTGLKNALILGKPCYREMNNLSDHILKNKIKQFCFIE